MFLECASYSHMFSDSIHEMCGQGGWGLPDCQWVSRLAWVMGVGNTVIMRKMTPSSAIVWGIQPHSLLKARFRQWERSFHTSFTKWLDRKVTLYEMVKYKFMWVCVTRKNLNIFIHILRLIYSWKETKSFIWKFQISPYQT